MENSICTIEQLKDFIDLSPKEEKKLKQITKRHPMRVTAYYMSLIDWDDPYDPIRKMAIPSLKEFNIQGSYDTSGEAENTKMSGLQHKYQETKMSVHPLTQLVSPIVKMVANHRIFLLVHGRERQLWSTFLVLQSIAFEFRPRTQYPVEN